MCLLVSMIRLIGSNETSSSPITTNTIHSEKMLFHCNFFENMPKFMDRSPNIHVNFTGPIPILYQSHKNKQNTFYLTEAFFGAVPGQARSQK